MNHYFCKTIPCVYAYASTNPIYKICKEWYFMFCAEKEVFSLLFHIQLPKHQQVFWHRKKVERLDIAGTSLSLDQILLMFWQEVLSPL